MYNNKGNKILFSAHISEIYNLSNLVMKSNSQLGMAQLADLLQTGTNRGCSVKLPIVG